LLPFEQPIGQRWDWLQTGVPLGMLVEQLTAIVLLEVPLPLAMMSG
jgi:hypothetical protein